METACPLYSAALGHPITTLPLRTTTAAVAPTTSGLMSTAVGYSLGRGGADARDPRLQRHQHIIQYSGWASFCRRCLKPRCTKHTACPTLSGKNNRVAPTRSLDFGGHALARARDAYALRPRLCLQRSGVRGRRSLSSYREEQQQERICPPAHPMLYLSCLLDLLRTIHFTHVSPHVLLAKNQIPGIEFYNVYANRDIYVYNIFC